MSAEPLRPRCHPRPAAGRRRPAVLAQPRGRRRDARVPGVPPPRVPGERLGVDRSGGPPRVPEADGRLAGAGRRHRLHAPARRAHRAVRAAARRRHARQAAVLRHRDVARRRRHRAAGREPRGPADQDRGQPRPSRQPRRHRRLRAGVGPHALRSRPLEDHHRAGRDPVRGARSSPPCAAPSRPRPPARAPGCASSPRRSTRRPWPRQIQQVLAAHPEAKWIQWEPTTRDNARAGARLAFGEYVEPVYDFEKADVILSLDGDFLAAENAFGVKYARAFAARRRVDTEPDRLSRLYVVEATPSVTGGRADHRLPLKSSQIDAFARAVAAAVGVPGITGGAPAGTEAHVAAIAKDLAAHRGTSLVVAGESQPPAVHADRPRHQRPARQRRPDRDLPAHARGRARRTTRGAASAGGRHRRRPRPDAAHRRRSEPGLQRAGRPRVRRRPEEGGVPGPLGTLPRRDRRALPVARAHDALSRDLERRAQRRRHRLDRAAAAAADVRRQVAARGGRDAQRPRRAQRLRRRPRALDRSDGPGDGRRRRGGPAACRAARRPPPSPAGTPAERRTAGAGSGGSDAGVVLREAVAQVAARRLSSPTPPTPPARSRWPPAGAPTWRRPQPSPGSRSSSSATRRSTTAASPTTAGCRSCPSR